MSAAAAEIRREILSELEELDRRRKYNALAYYKPYPKQKEFHDAGHEYAQRLLMAGNRTGKTWAGGFETAMHLTGQYPPWWNGLRFNRPIRMWAVGVTTLSTRDTMQRVLLGASNEPGTGSLPQKTIVKVRQSRGTPDAVDTIFVRHISGGFSTCGFRSYEQGIAKLMGETLDLAWMDEEPTWPIFEEIETRTATSGGHVYMTFSPLRGMSAVVRSFLKDRRKWQHLTRMTIFDAEHFSEEEREARIAKYKDTPDEKARIMGEPVLGSGLVYPVPRSEIQESGVTVADTWGRIVGMDIGWEHPTAAVWLAHDRDTDTVHVYDCYRASHQTAIVNAAAIKARGDWIPVAWPQDGLQHDKGSGKQIAEQYRQQGVKMLPKPATFENGTNGVEAGVQDILERTQTHRLKIASHLQDLWEEYGLYHREKGIITKELDDLMDAMRYGIMMLRNAKSHREHLNAQNSMYRPKRSRWAE